MKKIISIMVAVMFLSIGITWAEDYETPHILNSGETLSADVFNENFDEIRLARESFSEFDLIGKWNCTGYRKYIDGYTSVPENVWALSAAGLFYKSPTVEMEFIKGLFDTAGVTTEYPFYRDYRGPCMWEVAANVLFIKDTTNRVMAYNILPISKSRIMLRMVITQLTGISPTELYYPLVVICDKTSIPPTMPENLGFKLSGTEVALSWTDIAMDETEYRIYRKTEITGAWSLLDTVAKSSITHTDTVSLAAAPEYWYRVKAYNENGESIGSNVVYVKIAD